MAVISAREMNHQGDGHGASTAKWAEAQALIATLPLLIASSCSFTDIKSKRLYREIESFLLNGWKPALLGPTRHAGSRYVPLESKGI